MKATLLNAYRAHGKEIQQNLKERMELYSLMDADPVVAKAEKRHALLSIERFCLYHAWVHEPRPPVRALLGLQNATLPFVLYPFQKRAVKKITMHIEAGKDLLTEKSRTMGVTWYVDIVFLWFWLQDQGGNNFLVGSQTEKKVDIKGEISTIMEKIRYCLYQLHSVFLPDGFDIRRHDKHLLITNPVNGNTIQGESNNVEFSRSGRYKCIFLDEFSFWKDTDKQAWRATADSTPCRMVVSTPNGIGRTFATIRNSGSIEVLRLHWSLHPIFGAGKRRGVHPFKPELKDVWISEWYLKECERRRDHVENVFQELDIDYLSTGSPYFNNFIIQEKYQKLSDKPPQVKRYNFEFTGEWPKKKVKLFTDSNGPIRIIEKPAKYKEWKDRYCITADVAEGLEKGDFSVFYIYDRLQGVDVGWYHGHCDANTLAILLAHYGKKYDECWIGPEKNSDNGGAVIADLKKLYTNIMQEVISFDFIVDADSAKARFGWRTTNKTRGAILSRLRRLVNDNDDGIKDLDFFKEASSFAYNDRGKAEASGGTFDDRVIAQAIKFQLNEWLPPAKRVRGYKDGAHEDYQESDVKDWRTKLNVLRPPGSDGA